jgi:hypothetical protein
MQPLCDRGSALSPKKAKKSSARTRKAEVGSRNARRQPIDADVEYQALMQLIDLESPSRPYSRQLKKPIARASKADLMLRGSPDEQERLGHEDDMRILAEQFDKLFPLLDHFGIPQTSPLRWFHLAFQLAKQHVPGMKITKEPKKRRGPKAKWDGVRSDVAFIAAVAQLKDERKRGNADAIRTLRKRQPEVWGNYSHQSLRSRYYDIRKKSLPCPDGDLIDNLKMFFGLPARSGESDNSDG